MNAKIAIGAVIALLICVAATFYFWPKGATNKRGATNKSIAIAVLPFESLSYDNDSNRFFQDQVRREIITRLEQPGRLRVVSSDDMVPTPEVRENLKRLGVTHFLEGSVQRSADQVRITVKLIDAANDRHMWAQTYDRKLTALPSIETELQTEIYSSLGL